MPTAKLCLSSGYHAGLQAALPYAKALCAILKVSSIMQLYHHHQSKCTHAFQLFADALLGFAGLFPASGPGGHPRSAALRRQRSFAR